MAHNRRYTASCDYNQRNCHKNCEICLMWVLKDLCWLMACRMKELIPILLQYVVSRQKPRGYVMWVAHNARSFDAPFLIKEFSRCSVEIPPNWLFMDTLPLAREVVKSGGLFLFYLSIFHLYVCVRMCALRIHLKRLFLL